MRHWLLAAVWMFLCFLFYSWMIDAAVACQWGMFAFWASLSSWSSFETFRRVNDAKGA